MRHAVHRVGDSEEGFERLCRAVGIIDQRLEGCVPVSSFLKGKEAVCIPENCIRISEAMDAMARQPEVMNKLFTNMIVAAALIEGVALFAAVIAFLCVG